jgi:L-fuconolactonase
MHEPNLMRIDSHQHFWNYNQGEYPWIRPEWPIRRSYLPAAAAVELNSCQMDGCVAVQARQTLPESQWLLELADSFPFIKGVVGWVDLRAPDVALQLGRFAAHDKFVGVRHVLQDEADDNYMLDLHFQRGISQLRQFDLKYDLLIFPRQLPAAISLASAFPEQPFVLDHIAKPPIKEGVLDPWRGHLQMLATLPNVCCKVSGLITEADWGRWHPSQFRPYLDVVFEAFGPDRVMFGSDRPVALLAGTYRQVFELMREYVTPLGAGIEAGFFGGNAVNFYQLS